VGGEFIDVAQRRLEIAAKADGLSTVPVWPEPAIRARAEDLWFSSAAHKAERALPPNNPNSRLRTLKSL
jgi:hypothetical protein